MTSALKRHDDGTLELAIILPWDIVSKEHDETVTRLIEQVEVKGFRKGKAPREIAEKQLDNAKVYEEAIRHLVPEAYEKAIKEHTIRPIMQPDIHLKKAKEGETWEVVMYTCEKPTVDISSYKSIVQKARGELKKDLPAQAGDLWIPGKDAKNEKKEESADEKKQKQLNAVLDALLKEIDIKIPGILLTEDVNRRLSTFLDQLTKLGLTIDTYCKSKGTTPDELRKQYENEARNTYKLEFVLEEIADNEKVTVNDKEIEDVITKTSDPKEKKALQQNKYYIASLLRRQKTLDKLLSL
jgi:trigger factor